MEEFMQIGIGVYAVIFLVLYISVTLQEMDG